MRLMHRLESLWAGRESPFLIFKGKQIRFSDVASQSSPALSEVKRGDVVALIGDFDPRSISTLLLLIEKGAIVVPLTSETSHEHEYFFETALVNLVIDNEGIYRRRSVDSNALIEDLRQRGNPGLILFSTGTTGRPKAILHDLSLFLRRFDTPRPTLRTLSFLLFDHIGGINTLLHTLFNLGVVVAPDVRSVEAVLDDCGKFEVELLPTTPTFLRMILMSGLVPEKVPSSLRVITYGTERMDQPTLSALCELLPDVDFRQTFGTSELGIVRVKSEARNSLFMRIGGEGIETRIVDGTLRVRSETRMMGYLNAPSPFDADGWYDTKDIVEERDGLIRVVGRSSEVINVGGLKFMASEVERVALGFPGVQMVHATGVENPITGQHVELTVEGRAGSVLDVGALKEYLRAELQPHMVPRRVREGSIAVGHRFKRR
jgi:long-chain acyl-CoA synthetase